jgi:serine/threonine protein kinase
MAEEEFQLYELNRKGNGKRRVIINIEGDDTAVASTIRRQRGRTVVTNEPVLVQTATATDDVATLRNAVWVGERLHSGRRTPASIAPLLLFDVDEDGDPAVVVTSSRGAAIGELDATVLPLRGPAVPVAIRQLFEALEYLAARQVVHADVHPGTVRWDGTSLQICEFGHGTLQGRIRGYPGTAPYARADQTAGTGRASCLDDVYSAGLLLLPLIAGESPRVKELREQIGRQDAALARAIDAATSGRVSAGRVLDLLGLRVPPVRATQTGTPQQERQRDDGRRQFIEIRRRQNAFLTAYYANPVSEPDDLERIKGSTSRGRARAAATATVTYPTIGALKVIQPEQTVRRPRSWLWVAITTLAVLTAVAIVLAVNL